jgi:hypothetical protein
MEKIIYTDRVRNEELLHRVKEERKKRNKFFVCKRVIRRLKQACKNPGRQFAVATNFVLWPLIFWVLSLELDLFHPPDAYNFKVAARYLENLTSLI